MEELSAEQTDKAIRLTETASSTHSLSSGPGYWVVEDRKT